MLWNRVFSLPVSTDGEGRGVCQASRVYHLVMRKCCGLPFCPCLLAYGSVQLNCPGNEVLVSASLRCLILLASLWLGTVREFLRDCVKLETMNLVLGFGPSLNYSAVVDRGQGSSGLFSKIFRCLKAFFFFQRPILSCQSVF